MDLQNVVPGWGRLEGRFAKVSARAPVKLRTLIKEGRAMSVVDLLVKASKGLRRDPSREEGNSHQRGGGRPRTIQGWLVSLLLTFLTA
ncbi:hypothetical protein B6U84_06010 [Candidatus Bathyarchaeota archaeon ex4484_40]|nr:MAG: hypothetical protein B6U84_06010 [Candidatus Bathyarchaeota archaeon ex4484_40]